MEDRGNTIMGCSHISTGLVRWGGLCGRGLLGGDGPLALEVHEVLRGVGQPATPRDQDSRIGPRANYEEGIEPGPGHGESDRGLCVSTAESL